MYEFKNALKTTNQHDDVGPVLTKYRY